MHVLRVESELVLSKYKPKIIVITGSVGKTSTKDAIYAVLSKVSYVRKSEKSYNSELGLPLTVLGCPNGWNDPFVWIQNIFKGLWLFLIPHKYPKWLILEVGVGKPDDMKNTAAWLKTDIVVMTQIGETPAHIEFFESRKHLIEEKSGLIKTLKKDGLLILNSDDEDLRAVKGKNRSRIITYGLKEGADILGSGVDIFYGNGSNISEGNVPQGIIFRVDEGGKSLPVIIEGVFGKNHVYAALGALAVSSGLRFNILSAIEALKNYDVPPGRMRLLEGIKGSFIIDDTYNSSPFACKSALQTLGEVKSSGRKIAILGDMLELGKHTIEAHTDIGRVAHENLSRNTDILMVVGPRAKLIKEGAREAGMKEDQILEFSDSREAGEYVKGIVEKNDLILVKGSQAMRMERVSEAILLDQENKNKLLVRQDKEWLEKK